MSHLSACSTASVTMWRKAKSSGSRLCIAARRSQSIPNDLSYFFASASCVCASKWPNHAASSSCARYLLSLQSQLSLSLLNNSETAHGFSDRPSFEDKRAAPPKLRRSHRRGRGALHRRRQTDRTKTGPKRSPSLRIAGKVASCGSRRSTPHKSQPDTGIAHRRCALETRPQPLFECLRKS